MENEPVNVFFMREEKLGYEQTLKNQFVLENDTLILSRLI